MFFCLWIGTRTRKRVRKTAGFLWRKPSPLIVHQVHAFMQTIVHKRVFFFVFLYKYLVIFVCFSHFYLLFWGRIWGNFLLFTIPIFYPPFANTRLINPSTHYLAFPCYDQQTRPLLVLPLHILRNAYKKWFLNRIKYDWVRRY